MPIRVDWWPFQEALAPDGSGRQEVRIPEAYLEHLCANGPERKYYDADAIPDVLREPTSIHQGLRRAEFDESYCYCGKPKARWNGHSEEPPPPGMLFVVYVSLDEDEDRLTVFDWEWVKEDLDNPGCPPDCKQRFTRQTWPTT
jgi:hypothetical protein